MRGTVLVTGASGLVGSAVVQALRHRSGLDVVALTHRQQIAEPGVRTVPGDITAPRLGLDEDVHAELACTVTQVVHCAAQVGWLKAGAQLEATNVEGTRHTCAFAATARARLIHLSTAFVELPLTASSSAPVPGSRNHPGGYLDSKRAAEQLVREAPIDAVIARIPGMLGNSRTGETAVLQGFHRFVAAAVQGRIPAVPLLPASVLDIMATDVVAEAIAALVCSPGGTPPLVWLTAGPAAPTMAQVAATVTETAGALGLPAVAPELVEVAELARRLSTSGIRPGTPAWRRVADLSAMCEVYRHERRFPSHLGAIPGTSAPTTQSVLDALAALTRRSAR
ncbi:nucleoside-diphosphate-sugar epimerase [Kitasatospora sp. MAA4]|uniref:SDR family oxidoreductase n=1 Tax=Kitasatospora sp. MAA4 TaxID=3035093 RepID=UPI0024755ED0|nr:SDR family oxidoreductase [Kitasatospora sp. MAA4]MDH6137165.1 nucleoside-diphosphate-sugar epimerase [Kitasatospora sp. MAA4]